ncbi:uncharacterized protein KY384_008525 [Bacidia gigantensis]|uniref:uncharacterized protein n=1 Tax=Bacidia gigantensis TaxID=2732470 RepID=UPI001D03BB37|nr:uncharacterized protein KY384_008525 [Bacidia gigantensis]KAG8527096.1 hypothetical protein KY384_008525 [Bacidia gigantensis]
MFCNYVEARIVIDQIDFQEERSNQAAKDASQEHLALATQAQSGVIWGGGTLLLLSAARRPAEPRVVVSDGARRCRVVAALVLTAFALKGALAQPAHHNIHRHNQNHAELDKRQAFDKCDIENYKGAPWYAAKKASGGALDGCPSPASGTTPQVENKKVENDPAPSSSASSTPGSGGSSSDSTSKSSGGTGQCSDLKDIYTDPDTTGGQGPTSASSDCFKSSLSKRATDAQILTSGNTGGSCYGSNIQPEASCNPSGQFSLKITSNFATDSKYWVWNKAGPSDGISGMMNHAFHQFTLKKGQSALFNIEKGSIVGFSKAIPRMTSNGGVPGGPLGEVTYYCTAPNCNGGSYYDTSLVTYKEAGGEMYPLSIKADGYSTSSTTECTFTRNNQDHPDDSSCQMGPNSYDNNPFHVEATFG